MRSEILAAAVCAMLVAGCDRKPAAPPAPVVGGGAHEITAIFIRAGERPLDAKGALLMHVGDRVALRASAAWAIPSLTDETEKAVITVSDPGVGTLDARGGFIAKKPGHATIEAVLRIARAPGNQAQPIGATQTADGVAIIAPVTELRDRIDVEVVPN